MQKITSRRGGNIAFVNADRSTFNLPNVDRYHRLWLRFTGTMTITLGGGTAVVTQDAPYSVIRAIRVILSGYRGLGATTLFSLSGFQANIWERIENPNFTDNFAAPVAAGANTWTFNLLIPISLGETDFAGMLAFKSVEDRSATFSLEIDWGNVNQTGNGTSDVVTLAGGAANTAVLTAANLTVSSETFQFLTGEAERLGLREDLLHQISSFRSNIAATGALNIDLPVGLLYLRLIFLARNNALFANSIFDTFELVVEDSVRPYTIFEDQWRGQQRYRNLSDYPVGVYALDRYWTRTWRDVYDTTRLNRLQAVFNITAALTAPADVTTIREVVVPTPQTARKAA